MSMEESTRSPDTRTMLNVIMAHPYFIRAWEDTENVDRYLFVSDDGELSYTAHGMVAAHDWAVRHPVTLTFPDAAMIRALRRSEGRTPVSSLGIRSTADSRARAEAIKRSYPLPWEGPTRG